MARSIDRKRGTKKGGVAKRKSNSKFSSLATKDGRVKPDEVAKEMQNGTSRSKVSSLVTKEVALDVPNGTSEPLCHEHNQEKKLDPMDASTDSDSVRKPKAVSASAKGKRQHVSIEKQENDEVLDQVEISVNDEFDSDVEPEEEGSKMSEDEIVAKSGAKVKRQNQECDEFLDGSEGVSENVDVESENESEEDGQSVSEDDIVAHSDEENHEFMKQMSLGISIPVLNVALPHGISCTPKMVKHILHLKGVNFLQKTDWTEEESHLCFGAAVKDKVNLNFSQAAGLLHLLNKSNPDLKGHLVKATVKDIVHQSSPIPRSASFLVHGIMARKKGRNRMDPRKHWVPKNIKYFPAFKDDCKPSYDHKFTTTLVVFPSIGKFFCPYISRLEKTQVFLPLSWLCINKETGKLQSGGYLREIKFVAAVVCKSDEENRLHLNDKLPKLHEYGNSAQQKGHTGTIENLNGTANKVPAATARKGKATENTSPSSPKKLLATASKGKATNEKRTPEKSSPSTPKKRSRKNGFSDSPKRKSPRKSSTTRKSTWKKRASNK